MFFFSSSSFSLTHRYVKPINSVHTTSNGHIVYENRFKEPIYVYMDVSFTSMVLVNAYMHRNMPTHLRGMRTDTGIMPSTTDALRYGEQRVSTGKLYLFVIIHLFNMICASGY